MCKRIDMNKEPQFSGHQHFNWWLQFCKSHTHIHTHQTVHRITIIRNRKLNRINSNVIKKSSSSSNSSGSKIKRTVTRPIVTHISMLFPLNTMFNIVIYFVITLINSRQLCVYCVSVHLLPIYFCFFFLFWNCLCVCICAEESMMSMMSIHIITLGLFVTCV